MINHKTYTNTLKPLVEESPAFGEFTKWHCLFIFGYVCTIYKWSGPGLCGAWG